MRNLVFLLFAVALFTSACKSSSKSTASKEGMAVYGQDFAVKNVQKFDAVIASLKTKDKIDVQVEGVVDAVCQVKGCWMNLSAPNSTSTEKMFVKFHEYSFFMPKDLPGKQVIMKGTAFVEETPVSELKHYAEDEGKSPEEIAKITKPLKEIKFVATGVKVKS
jgi:hypothetical protein